MRNFHQINYTQFDSILDETTGVCNKQLLDEHINAGLQIKRLLEIRKWGLIMLFTFLAFSSLIVNIEFIHTWRYIIYPDNLYIMSFSCACLLLFLEPLVAFSVA